MVSTLFRVSCDSNEVRYLLFSEFNLSFVFYSRYVITIKGVNYHLYVCVLHKGVWGWLGGTGREGELVLKMREETSYMEFPLLFFSLMFFSPLVGVPLVVYVYDSDGVC
jgi:hypothetical protein